MAMVKCILAEQQRGGKGTTILKDEITGKKYNLLSENGFLQLQEVSDGAGENDIELIDIATGKVYKLVVESSILKLQEV